MQDHYMILGLTSNATPEEITRVFREKSRKWHPDAWPARHRAYAEEHYKKLTLAYAVLSDPKRRQEYDASRKPAPMVTEPMEPEVCGVCGDHLPPNEIRRFEGRKLCEGCFWTQVMERRKQRRTS